MISHRLSQITESATLKLNALVNQMKARGEDVSNLTAGEPDFPVPDLIKQAVIKALDQNKSKYAPVPGIPELRNKIAQKTRQDQPEIDWNSSHVVVSNGGKQAVFNAVFAVMNPGDIALIPAPYWLSYPEIVKLAEGVVVEVKLNFESDYRLSPQQLTQTLDQLSVQGKKAKILFLNSPSNPTGSLYTQEEFVALAQVIENHHASKDLWVISDEIYDHIVFSPYKFCSFLKAVPHFKDRTVTVNGLSKGVAMTGWRVGWSVAPEPLTKAIQTLQGQCTSGINSLMQWASLAAFDLLPSYYEGNIKTYEKRRDIALEILKKAGKIKVFAPHGAFYIFVNLGDCLKANESATGFAERALIEAQVAVVSGEPFGDSRSVRLSFATNDSELVSGFERFVKFCAR